MLVLPDVAAGPGMGITSGILCIAYLFNLISGLAIAQVAIQQHDTSGSDVPSSFKEFSEATLPSAANIVSGISVFCNAGVSCMSGLTPILALLALKLDPLKK